MILLGLVGKKGAGKDTAAGFLTRDHGFVRMAYADPLKEACRVVLGLSEDDVTDPSRKEEVSAEWGMTPRRIMQIVGTDLFRNGFRDDVWLRNMERRIRSSGAEKIVITDCRFENEAELVRRLGGVLFLIERKGDTTDDVDAHASERLDVGPVDAILRNDSTPEGLRAGLISQMKSMSILPPPPSSSSDHDSSSRRGVDDGAAGGRPSPSSSSLDAMRS